MRFYFLIAAVAAPALLGCRPDPGEPNYPVIEPYVDTDENGFLPGSDPFEAGERRLALGTAYEGDASDFVVVDDETVHFYIYEGSFSISPDPDRVEGYQSERAVVSSSAFWGGGIHFDNKIDLTSWTTMHIALKSEDASMEALALGIVGSGGEVRANVTDYGFVADGEWHEVNIPMTAFATAGLAQTEIAPLIISATAVPGDAILFDDFYFKGE